MINKDKINIKYHDVGSEENTHDTFEDAYFEFKFILKYVSPNLFKFINSTFELLDDGIISEFECSPEKISIFMNTENMSDFTIDYSDAATVAIMKQYKMFISISDENTYILFNM